LEAPPEVKVLYRRIGVEWESVLHSNLMLGMLGGRRKNQGTKGPMVFLCHKMVSPRKWRMVGIAKGWSKRSRVLQNDEIIITLNPWSIVQK
jgi:hypothetical protein